MSRLIVCLTGMPGAGKSTIAAGLRARGFPVVTLGDEVRAEARRRNLEPTAENLGVLMMKLRRDAGPGAIASLILPRIRDAGPGTVIVDGIRSGAEIDVLRGSGTVRVLSVHASVDTRFQFLKNRGRSDDPKAERSFRERDLREMKVGISAPIALADEAISNNHVDIDLLVESAFRVVSLWEGRNGGSGE